MTQTPDRLDHQVQFRLTTAERDEYQRIADARFEGRMSSLIRRALREYVARLARKQEEQAA